MKETLKTPAERTRKILDLHMDFVERARQRDIDARTEGIYLTFSYHSLCAVDDILFRPELVMLGAFVQARGEEATSSLEGFVRELLGAQGSPNERCQKLLATAFGPLIAELPSDLARELPLFEDQLTQLARRVFPESPLPGDESFPTTEAINLSYFGVQVPKTDE